MSDQALRDRPLAQEAENKLFGGDSKSGLNDLKDQVLNNKDGKGLGDLKDQVLNNNGGDLKEKGKQLFDSVASNFKK